MRFTFISVLAGTFTACALAAISDTATLQTNGDRVTLSVESPRPVAKAITALAERYAYPITYEDPRYVYEGDVRDITAEVSRTTAGKSLTELWDCAAASSP